MAFTLPRFYRRTSTAVLVLAIGLVLSVAAALLVARQGAREARSVFEGEVSDARDAIAARIQTYANVLGGIRGLIAATESLRRDQFRRYVESLDLSGRYPGIQALSYGRHLTAAQRPAFEARVREDTSVEPRGYPEFGIKPPGERAEYVVVEYVEPMSGNEGLLGLDLAGDAVRLETIERARDSGQITVSGIIAQAQDPKRYPAFAMRAAVYRKGAPLATAAQRREAFVGVVSASFIVADLMREVLSDAFLQSIHVRAHDAGYADGGKGREPPAPGNLLFDSEPAAQKTPAGAGSTVPSTMVSLEVGGRRWNLYFRARQDLRAPHERWLPWITLLAGGAISLLLFGLTRSLATTGSKATELAERITADLRRSEADLAEAQRRTQQLIEVLPNPIFFKGTDGRYQGVNKAWEAYFQTPRESFVGKTVHDLYPNDPDVAARLHAMDEALWQNPDTPQSYETGIVTPDGRQHDAIYYKATFRRADGAVAGLIGTIVDITERKRAEKALRDSESRYRSVVAAIAEGVLLRDREGRIVACNASAERIVGRSFEQMRGSLVFDPSWQAIREDGTAFPEELRPARTVQRTGQPQHGVVMGFRKPDGSVLWLSLSAQPLFDDSSASPSGVVTTIVDITQRKQLELRQSMQHNITRLLSQAETLEEFIPQVIQTICDALGCVYGGCWLRDRENQMVTRVSSWSAASAEVAEFAARGSQAMPWPLTPGGLIRRAWESGEPVWIGDCAQDPSFRRAPLAAKAGLHGAFAFPIRSQSEVLGVLEFFSRELCVPDETLVQITGSIGSQVGQFLARKQAELRVRHLANYDELTGLPNRSMFHQRFGHALTQARRNARTLAVLFIDLDRFKNINDTLGHAAGDRVLKVTADRLRGCLRESDTVGRLGGDEFVVLMEDPSQPAQIGLVAQKIIAAVAEPIALDPQEVHITASIGISTYPADSADVESLMKNADIAMYRAKDQGKNTYQFYSAQMNIHTVERLAMESDLRRALEREEFLLHYQPRIAIDSTRIAGVEALLRWQQPTRALVPPAQFIPLAEETGLIVPIGEWALKTACALNKSWQDRGLPRLRMAVNLSARQFAQKNLVQSVVRMLGETGLPAAALEFEITESMVMSNAQEAAALLKRLKDMGIYISIDDFGTGYSSLGYLKRFPIDSVKIDKSFVQDLPGDEDDAAITSAIIAMAHNLKLKTVAEGVETEAQLRFLRELGCDEMQGYLFSRPLPAEEILRLLREAASSGTKPFPGIAAIGSRPRRG